MPEFSHLWNIFYPELLGEDHHPDDLAVRGNWTISSTVPSAADGSRYAESETAAAFPPSRSPQYTAVSAESTVRIPAVAAAATPIRDERRAADMPEPPQSPLLRPSRARLSFQYGGRERECLCGIGVAAAQAGSRKSQAGLKVCSPGASPNPRRPLPPEVHSSRRLPVPFAPHPATSSADRSRSRTLRFRDPVSERPRRANAASLG